MTKAKHQLCELAKSQSPACVRYEKPHHLASGTNPVICLNGLSITLIMLFSYNTKSRQEKKTFHIEEARLRKNKLLGDLFDGDLY